MKYSKHLLLCGAIFLFGGLSAMPLPANAVFLSGRPRPPDNAPLCGAAPFARFATSGGLRPPSVTNPATLSHPD
jgi:hypothetical protein